MAHLIEQRADGEHSFFEIGAVKTAWHQLGKLFAKAFKSTQELFDAAPYLGYSIEARELGLTLVNPDGDFYTRPSKFARSIVRTDTNEELGSVGPMYVPISNRDVVDMTVGPLIDSGTLLPECGGVLRDGADAWLTLQFDSNALSDFAKDIYTKDGIIPYAVLNINHVGRRANSICVTEVRQVCANTQAMVEAQVDSGDTLAASIRHKKNAHANHIKAAHDVLGKAIKNFDAMAHQHVALQSKTLSDNDFAARVIIPLIGIHPTHRDTFKDDSRKADYMVSRYENRRDIVSGLWLTGKGHVGDLSAWEAYCGAVEAIDHTKLFSASEERRISGMISGDLRDAKQKVLDNLLRETASDNAMALVWAK